MSEISEKSTLVFVAQYVGLANRLRALVGYTALAKVLNRQFLLCWVRDAGCDAEFCDLFNEPDFTLIRLEQLAVLRPRDRVWIATDCSWFHEIWRRYAPHIHWLKFLDEVSISLSHLRLRSNISEAVARFSQTHPMSTAIGVHIRHTDNVDTAGTLLHPEFDLKSASTLIGFREAIRAHISTNPVFLATDNSAVEKTFRQEFGDAMFTYPKVYQAEWHSAANPWAALLLQRTTLVVEALIEMLLLGSCYRIIGTYYSSFSEFSALWGRADYCEVQGAATGRNARIDGTINELKTLVSARLDRRIND